MTTEVRSHHCLNDVMLVLTTCLLSGVPAAERGPEDVSLLERCPHFRGWYVQPSMAEDMSLLERCPHFRGWYVQPSMAEDVSPLEWSEGVCTGFNGVGTYLLDQYHPPTQSQYTPPSEIRTPLIPTYIPQCPMQSVLD